MLDFRRGPRPRNYLSRREQWRLLLLVMLLGLSIFLVAESRDATNFQWLWAIGEGGPPAMGSGDSAPVDTRSGGRDPEDEIPGTFRSPAPNRDDPPTSSDRLFPGVEDADLGQIRDDSPFRSAEAEPWFHLFHILDDTGEEALEDASIGRVTFVQLYQQPDQYRGELVTLRGMLRRTEQMTAPPNDHGFRSYYRVALQPSDSPENPVFAYVLELPQDMPRGSDIDEAVEITGFFFKRWEYLAQRDLRIAPVVLAKTVRWTPSPSPVQGPAGDVLPLGVLVALAAGLALLVTLTVYYRTRSGAPLQADSLPASRMFRSPKASPEDVGRRLKELAEQQQTHET